MTEFDPATVPAFDVLGQELRVSILEALVEKRTEDPQRPALSFSELRERVGVDDSGRFNYHLGKLTEQFLQETDDGYELNAAGQEVAGAVLSGSFDTESQWGPTELDAPCRECGETVAASYEDGMIFVECENGHLNHRDYFPGAIVDRLPLPEAIGIATILGQQDIELLLRDICPNCYGATEVEATVEDGHPVLTGRCHQCGYFQQGPLSLVVLTHPILQAFYFARGRDVRETSLWTLPFLTDPDRWDVRSENPLRVEVDASYHDDELTFLIDEDCSVIDYTVTDLQTERT